MLKFQNNELKNDLVIAEKNLEAFQLRVQAAQEEALKQEEGVDIVNYARQFIGNPYVWGGSSLTNGCDCSHFVWLILKDLGYYTGQYYTSYSWNNLGEEVQSIEQAKAGDIICYGHHVAIYDGQGFIIQAQSSAAGITDYRSVFCHNILAIRRFSKQDNII